MKGVLETYDFLKEKGIRNFSFYRVIEKFDDLRVCVDAIGFPCFLKVDLAEHKTELGAVRRCKDFLELKEAFDFFKKNFPNNKIIFQEEQQGLELFLGIKKDKVFGYVLGLGIGGINVEVFDDISFRMLPFDKTEVFKMIDELKFKEIFFKRKKYDLDNFIKLVLQLSKIGENFHFLDLNPLILNERGCFIIDARGDW